MMATPPTCASADTACLQTTDDTDGGDGNAGAVTLLGSRIGRVAQVLFDIQ
jgi:hypothetical protein